MKDNWCKRTATRELVQDIWSKRTDAGELVQENGFKRTGAEELVLDIRSKRNDAGELVQENLCRITSVGGTDTGEKLYLEYPYLWDGPKTAINMSLA